MFISPYPPRGGATSLSSLAVEVFEMVSRHRGTTRYVDSNVASGGGVNGTTWNDAFTTMEAADNVCAVDDTVVVAPAHVETVTAAAGLSLDIAGVTWVGLGIGDRSPQVNFTTSGGSDMDVDAAAITMKNFRFTGTQDTLTGPIDVNAADFTLIDCVTEDASAVQATDFIVLDAAADRCSLFRHVHKGDAAAGADTFLTAVGCDRLTIEDLIAEGDFAVGVIELAGTACTNVKFYGGMNQPSHLKTTHSNDIIFDDVITASYADVGPGLFCTVADNAAGTLAEMTVNATGSFFDPIEMVNLAGESSVGTDISPSAD